MWQVEITYPRNDLLAVERDWWARAPTGPPEPRKGVVQVLDDVDASSPCSSAASATHLKLRGRGYLAARHPRAGE
jgi:hypothetical protein